MSHSPLHIKTPLIKSAGLSRDLNKSIYLKMDNMQPPGSFKIRGIGKLCEIEALKGATHFVSSSGGNAGVAVAYAGRHLSIPVTVFIPKTSHPIFIQALKGLNAKVVIEGDVWDETHKAATRYMHEKQATYIPPFDHPILWEGHSSIVDEVVEEGVKPDAVILAVGGGGLACGVLHGMHQHGWDTVPLITVETTGAASFARSVEADQLVTLDAIDTIATSLGAKRVTEQLFNWSKKHELIPVTVTDNRAINACYEMLNMHRVLVEPSAGAALSMLFDQHDVLAPYQSVLVIVCGGIGISLALLQAHLAA